MDQLTWDKLFYGAMIGSTMDGVWAIAVGVLIVWTSSAFVLSTLNYFDF